MTTLAKAKPQTASETLWENVRTILYALALAMLIRFAIAQPFRIPSGSMQPTMLVGDYIVVTKWSYGYSRFSIAPLERLAPPGRIFSGKPERGDIIVFRPPSQPDKDFVKRLIGMPGDVIQMKRGILHINGEPVEREFVRLTPFEDAPGVISEIPTYRETLPNGVSYITFDREANGGLDDTEPYRVPEGRYFMMGDDRDNSHDSRVGAVGYVPFDHFVGEAQFVFVSFDETTKIWAPWTWFTGFRLDRFVKGFS